MISPGDLQKIFGYDSASGNLVWKYRPDQRPCFNARYAGTIAGSLHANGRIVVKIRGRGYYAHRVIWAIVYGDWPPNFIDHIDQNPTNNRIENLRACTHSENLQNRKILSSNTSGYPGVSFTKSHNKWRSQIRVNNRVYFLGYFGSPQQAFNAYLRAKAEHHPFQPTLTKGEF